MQVKLKFSPWRSRTSVSRKGNSVTSARSEWNVPMTFWTDVKTASSSLSELCNTDENKHTNK